MKLHRGQVAFESLKTLSSGSYDQLAHEYYDARLHPTCADLRNAAKHYLKRLFDFEKPAGRIADVGCGASVLAEFGAQNLVLIDSSSKMLRKNSQDIEQRNVDVMLNQFGSTEFDWIFAILGDPYNTISAWKNIKAALKSAGSCVFIVPSFTWAARFRSVSDGERENYALFVTSTGEEIFVPSFILPEAEQKHLVESAGLSIRQIEHVSAGEAAPLRSPKISNVLAEQDFVLDIYRVEQAA